jgi:soluble lytic murein transglycosylase-like protein
LRLWRAALAGVLIAGNSSAARAQWIGAKPNLKALYAIAGRIHNIDANLLEAMVQVESGGDPQSVSPKGAMGLMQLMPETANEFSVIDPFDPVSNVLGAAGFLEYLRTRFSGNLALRGLPDLLAAYNAGPKAVEKYQGVPPYHETRQYVRRVLDRYTSAMAVRSDPGPQLVLKTVPVEVRSPTMVISAQADADDSLLDQLSTIRRLRGQFVASMPRRLMERGLDQSRR